MKIISTIILIFFASLAWAQSTVDAVKIYPNPATETLNIVVDDLGSEKSTISIHSIIGNKMQVDIDKLNTNSFRAHIKDLPQGYYLVVVKSKNINSTVKFLKK